MATKVERWLSSNKKEFISEEAANLYELKAKLNTEVAESDHCSYGTIDVDNFADIVIENAELARSILNFYK